jgi:hypothetical protein
MLEPRPHRDIDSGAMTDPAYLELVAESAHVVSLSHTRHDEALCGTELTFDRSRPKIPLLIQSNISMTRVRIDVCSDQ